VGAFVPTSKGPGCSRIPQEPRQGPRTDFLRALLPCCLPTSTSLHSAPS
jgi:hypothetical protein